MLQYFIAIIVIAFVLTIFSGLGILTNGLFKITHCYCGYSAEHNKDAVNAINAVPNDQMNPTQKAEAISKLPSVEVPNYTDDRRIILTDSEIVVSKIGIITLWIMILIGIIFGIYKAYKSL